MSEELRARLGRSGQDKIITEVMKVPQIRVMEYEGIVGVWVPLHPLAEVQRAKTKKK